MFAKHVVAVGLGLFCVTVFSPTSFGQTAPEQDDEPSARGAFLATRPGAHNPNHTTTNTKGAAAAAAGGAGSATNRTKGNRQTGTKGGAGKVPADPIGLGYTLYMRAADGGAVRVDPSKEFREGDEIRVALEANTDGHLYIFHTEDGRNPQMLFPDARLNRGANAIRAHVLYQVPSALTGWFKFNKQPAIEQLYIVVARAPLPDVPTSGELIKNCESNAAACEWRPAAPTWARIKTRIKSPASARAAVSRSTEFGQKESQIERDSLTRGLGLSLDAPAPSVVRINTSSNKNILVTTVELVHK